jgi:hypothetical protein
MHACMHACMHVHALSETCLQAGTHVHTRLPKQQISHMRRRRPKDIFPINFEQHISRLQYALRCRPWTHCVHVQAVGFAGKGAVLQDHWSAACKPPRVAQRHTRPAATLSAGSVAADLRCSEANTCCRGLGLQLFRFQRAARVSPRSASSIDLESTSLPGR